MSDPTTSSSDAEKTSPARKFTGVILLLVFIIVILGLLITLTDRVKNIYTGEDKDALYLYIGMSWAAFAFILFTYIAVLVTANSKVYLTLGVISFLLVITQILLAELYLPQQNITDDKIEQFVRISNLLVILTEGMLLGMAFQKPNKLLDIKFS